MAYDHGAFRVTNIEKAMEFYTKTLGFTLLFTSESEEQGEKGAFLEFHGARLELIETTRETYVPEEPKHPYCPHLCFQADNMEDVIQMLNEHSISVLNGPNEIPGSEQWIYFTDPDKNVLEYIVWLEKSKQ